MVLAAPIPLLNASDAGRFAQAGVDAAALRTSGAAAADLSLLPADSAGGAAGVNYLEVVLNEVPTGRLARFVIHGDRIAADAGTLRGLGLQWPGSEQASGLVPLQELPGLRADYVVKRQQIRLTVPVELLAGPPRRTGYVQAEPAVIDPATRAPGLVLLYDAFAQDGDDGRSVSAWSEWRLFGRAGLLSNSMVSRYAESRHDAARTRNTRLDTYWQLDFPDRMLTLAVGDTITGALPWTRPTRVGGIRFSRNFALQPYRVHTPLVSFTGESALPSTVDLFINGVRQSSNPVLPGQFQIDSVPTLSGAGQAQVAITDINGRVQLVNFSLYGAPQLLQEGMSDWSIELGAVREHYGRRSFAYRGDPMASATGRYGMSNRVTLEGHAEGSAGLAMAGLGGHWLVGEAVGIVSLAAAASHSGGEYGALVRAGYQWNSPGFNTGLTTTVRDRDFRDVASLDGTLPPRRTDQAYVGFSAAPGYFSVNYVRQEYEDIARSRLVSVNWSRQLPRSAMLSLGVFRDLDRDDGHRAHLYLSVPFDRHTQASISARHARSGESLAVEARRNPQTDLGGWGWRAQASAGESAGGQAEVTRLGRIGRWTAGVDHYRRGDRTTAYGSASGGVVFMGGHVRGVRRVDDAFAMVSTDGVPGVPVRLENRLVGHTDDDGVLLLDRLNAHQRNLLSIDTLELPVEMHVERTAIEAVPATRSGTLVKFPMRRVLSVQLVLRRQDGSLPAAGSAVSLDRVARPGATLETVVGFDGRVHLQDPAPGAVLHVRVDGAECRAVLPGFPAGAGLLDLGEVVCR